MANTKHEDAILKMGFEYFRDTILKTLGIDYDFVESGITELVELTIHSLYMDFTFLTTGGFYIHIEFQTTDSGKKDLRRFHAYESVLSHKTGKNVITYVIYSGGIEHTVTEIDCGMYSYRVIPIYLSDKNADTVLKRLQEKKRNGELFTEEDFAQIKNSGYQIESFRRPEGTEKDGFQTLYFMNLNRTEEELVPAVEKLFGKCGCTDDSEKENNKNLNDIGKVFRVKGFMKNQSGDWMELNATTQKMTVNLIKEGQEILIVIGEDLKEDKIRECLEDKCTEGAENE